MADDLIPVYFCIFVFAGLPLLGVFGTLSGRLGVAALALHSAVVSLQAAGVFVSGGAVAQD